MARIVKEIEIEGKEAIALFDTGAMYTYVLNEYVRITPTSKSLVLRGGKECLVFS
ncbi:MAG: hypothetical protein AB1567_04950 [bacterium]